jgi:HK97 family phage major capsid protein
VRREEQISTKEIKAMRSNILALRQRKTDLVKAQRKMLDTISAEERDFSEAEGALYNDNIKKLAALEVNLQREEETLINEKSMLGQPDENAAFSRRAGIDTPNAGEDASGKTPAKPFGSFGEQLIAVARAANPMNRIDPRLIQAAAPNASGLNEASPSDGGFLVQKDFSELLLERTYQLGNVSQRVFRVPISANANGVKINAIDEDSRTDGTRWGGVLAYWQNEADTKVGSRPKFRQIEIQLNKLTGLCYATDELLQDAAALEAVITKTFPMEMNFRVEDAIFNGTGAGQPLGFMNSGAVIEVPKDAGDPAGVGVSTNDVLAMWGRMWGPSRQDACWFVNQDVERFLYPLTLGSGTATQMLYFPPGYSGGMNNAPPNPGPWGRLIGRPVIPVEYCATCGTPGDIVLVDLSQYVMADKGAPMAASSIHVRFLNDETTFRFVYRVDGQPVWKKPLTPKNGTVTLSPFIRLAVRS